MEGTNAGMITAMMALIPQLMPSLVEELENRLVAPLKKEISFLKQKIERSEAQERRNNLIVRGVGEGKKENWAETERRFRSAMRAKGLPAEGPIERCHRLGRNREEGNRPIIVKFSAYKDREAVYTNKAKLAGSNIYIEEDFPSSMRWRRSTLLRYAKAISWSRAIRGPLPFRIGYYWE